MYQKKTKQPFNKAKAKDAFEAYSKISSKTGRVTSTGTCRDIWAIKAQPKCITTLWLGHDSPKKIGEKSQLIIATEKLMEKLN